MNFGVLVGGVETVCYLAYGGMEWNMAAVGLIVPGWVLPTIIQKVLAKSGVVQKFLTRTLPWLACSLRPGELIAPVDGSQVYTTSYGKEVSALKKLNIVSCKRYSVDHDWGTTKQNQRDHYACDFSVSAYSTKRWSMHNDDIFCKRLLIVSPFPTSSLSGQQFPIAPGSKQPQVFDSNYVSMLLNWIQMEWRAHGYGDQARQT